MAWPSLHQCPGGQIIGMVALGPSAKPGSSYSSVICLLICHITLPPASLPSRPWGGGGVVTPLFDGSVLRAKAFLFASVTLSSAIWNQ